MKVGWWERFAASTTSSFLPKLAKSEKYSCTYNHEFCSNSSENSLFVWKSAKLSGLLLLTNWKIIQKSSRCFIIKQVSAVNYDDKKHDLEVGKLKVIVGWILWQMEETVSDGEQNQNQKALKTPKNIINQNWNILESKPCFSLHYWSPVCKLGVVESHELMICQL